jgi:hypothetical protein
MEELRKCIYPHDADRFIIQSQMTYLSLCTPSAQDDEYVLTENAYNIHEGPNSFLISQDTGESVTKCYTGFHVFAVITKAHDGVLKFPLTHC